MAKRAAETPVKAKPAPRRILDPRSPTFSRDFRLAAREFTKRATASPEAALAVLVDEGILTKSGKLHKNYRPH
jgi:hypothetical protein